MAAEEVETETRVKAAAKVAVKVAAKVNPEAVSIAVPAEKAASAAEGFRAGYIISLGFCLPLAFFLNYPNHYPKRLLLVSGKSSGGSYKTSKLCSLTSSIALDGVGNGLQGLKTITPHVLMPIRTCPYGNKHASLSA